MKNQKITVPTLLLTLVMVAASTAAPVMAAGATTSTGACGPTDLAVILDVTGSMGGAISNVQAEIPTIISTADAASGGDLNLGLVTFGDTVNVLEPLTPKSAGGEIFFASNLSAQNASGGGDNAEPSDEAKNTVINNLPGGVRSDVEGYIADGAYTPTGDFTNPWRSGALKLVVLITDAPSNGFSENATGSHVPLGDAPYAAHLASLGTDAAGKGIKVFDVFVNDSGDYAGQLENLTADAVNSGGAILVTAPNGTGTGAAIETVLATCGAPTSRGSISGMKFNDLDANGIRNAGESGIANWTIKLTNESGGVITMMTDANGNYSFTNLSDGNYTVGEVIQSGWIQTAPAMSTNGTATYQVQISGGNAVTGEDFGNFHKGDITGGGWINITGDPKATFGIVGHYPGGSNTAQGSVQYQDHNASLNIKSIQINTLATTLDKKKGVITGLAQVNGNGSYPFVVYVEDIAEPGVGADVFRISLPTYPYSNGAILSGGNIQIHS